MIAEAAKKQPAFAKGFGGRSQQPATAHNEIKC
jgi:hypothetical protein